MSQKQHEKNILKTDQNQHPSAWDAPYARYNLNSRFPDIFIGLIISIIVIRGGIQIIKEAKN